MLGMGQVIRVFEGGYVTYFVLCFVGSLVSPTRRLPVFLCS